MQVILLQKVRNLGDLGDTVQVRPGYGRNYLMPRGIALPATSANLKVFEQRRAELMAQSEERLDRARARAESIRGREFVVAMRASDEGKLYGSVGPHEIADKITEEAAEVDAREVVLPDGQIRLVGEHAAVLQLHPEVEFEVSVVVAQLTDMGINMPTRSSAAEDAQAGPGEAEAAQTDAGAGSAEEVAGSDTGNEEDVSS